MLGKVLRGAAASSKSLGMAASAVSWLAALSTALFWGSPKCTCLVLLLPKQRCWPVSRSARRCPALASRGSGTSGKAPRDAAAPTKSLGEGAASLVSPLPNARCLLMAQLIKNSGWIWACGAQAGAMCAAWDVENGGGDAGQEGGSWRAVPALPLAELWCPDDT